MEHLATGCKPDGFWTDMSLWQEWGINFLPRMGDGLCRAMGGAVPGGWPDPLIYIVLGIIGSLLVVNVATLGVPYVILMERKLLGRFTQRPGPNRVGVFGLLQPVADALKLMTKEDTTPRAADKFLFGLAPLAFAAMIFAMFAVIPWGPFGAVLANIDVGILYVIGVTTAAEIAVFMGGWSSNNKYSLFGAMRAVALLVSYEIPLVLSIMGVVVLTGSLNLTEIVEQQRFAPNLAWMPLGFIVFAIAVSAELNRAPFDLLEADSEIVSGFHTEYSGMKWTVVQLAEYAAIIGFSAITATLFLSGFKGPEPIPPYLWLVLKMGFVIGVLIWVRATVPRLRVDQIMGFGWKFLLPLSIVNLFVVAAEVVAFRDAADLPYWIIPVNFAIAIGSIVVMTRILGFQGRTRRIVDPSRPVIAGEPAAVRGEAAGG